MKLTEQGHQRYFRSGELKATKSLFGEAYAVNQTTDFTHALCDVTYYRFSHARSYQDRNKMLTGKNTSKLLIYQMKYS